MDEIDQAPKRRFNPRVTAGAVGLLAAGAVAGGLLAGSLTASADTAPLAAPSASASADADRPGGHRGAGGPNSVRSDEKVLTGDQAARAKAAALTAVPGGTVIRVETDGDGAAYEAHMTKADGTAVTVKFDKNFKVTGTEDGMGKHK